MEPDAVHRLALGAGLPHEASVIAVAIAWPESGLDPDAVGDEDLQDDVWGPSCGLWQIRSLRADRGTGRARDIDRLLDPAFNAGAMVAISKGGTDWSPWTMWKNGGYRQYLAGVRAAVAPPMTPVEIIRAAMVDVQADGVPVAWVSGWETRGRPYAFAPKGAVDHHTATRGYEYDYPSLGIVRDGRSDLPGPLSQFGIGRITGTVYVIAGGYANHAGGGGWEGLSGNGSVWGASEAENDGIGETISPLQTKARLSLHTALARHTGYGAEMISCHREWSDGGKIDPTGVDGDWLRAQVAERLAGTHPAPQPEEFTMFIGDAPPARGGGVWQSDGVLRKPVRTGDTWAQLGDDGARVAKHIGVFEVGTFDDLIDIEAVLAQLSEVTSAGGVDLSAIADRGAAIIAEDIRARLAS